MKPYIATIGIDLDARRDLLLHLKQSNPEFFNRLYAKLKDKLTYSDFDKALVETLASTGITIMLDEELTLMIEYRTKSGNTILEVFQDFESALQFAIALLKIR